MDAVSLRCTRFTVFEGDYFFCSVSVHQIIHHRHYYLAGCALDSVCDFGSTREFRTEKSFLEYYTFNNDSRNFTFSSFYRVDRLNFFVEFRATCTQVVFHVVFRRLHSKFDVQATATVRAWKVRPAPPHGHWSVNSGPGRIRHPLSNRAHRRKPYSNQSKS